MSDKNTNDQSAEVFHEGERRVQERAGGAERVAFFAKKFISSTMPDQHREFYSQLPQMIVGAIDSSGHPWASALFGKPGFIQSPDAKTLVFDSEILLQQELDLQLDAGAKLGFVGIELETRRRNRINGTVTFSASGQLSVQVDQAFGNCPQYIQQRETSWHATTGSAELKSHTGLLPEAEALINNADTLFIASRSPALNDDPRAGVDVSHRGGLPGFIKSVDDGCIAFPDFAGNRFFQTLGNIDADGRVGLFFPDYESGDAVFLTGDAEIVWDSEALRSFKGADRLVVIKPSRCVYARSALPLKAEFIDYAVQSSRVGNW